MATTIYFDMDGTLVDLYSVKDWLPHLRAEDASPYKQALPLVDTVAFIHLCQKLKSKGYKLSIISWGSKYASTAYLKATAKAKRRWLRQHFKGIRFDKIKIVPYGKAKTRYINPLEYSILFDDNAKVRQAWNDKPFCTAYSEKEMMSMLKCLSKI